MTLEPILVTVEVAITLSEIARQGTYHKYRGVAIPFRPVLFQRKV